MNTRLSFPRPLVDADLPAFIDHLDIPGIVDVHTHFLPPRVQTKVWDFFESGQGGRRWDVRYKGTVEARIARLADLGVQRYTALAYAHQPEMAAWLNEWTLDLADRYEPIQHSATFHAEPNAADYVALALRRGTKVFKVHLVVGAFDPWHPDLHDVWRQIESAGVSVVIHVGGYPHSTPWTGAERLADVLAAHPRLRLVIAHMGTPDYAPLLELCRPYPQIKWDTTMILTRFWGGREAMPEVLGDLMVDEPHRIVFGSDFPAIPHAYAHQVDALRAISDDAEWLRTVLHDSGIDSLTPAPPP